MKTRFLPIIQFVDILEVLLAVIIILAVMLCGVGLLWNFLTDYTAGEVIDIQSFLSKVLLLVIGLELALVLIKHTLDSVLHVVIFAVARKVLIFAESSWEVAIGVASLAALFAVRKYLFDHENITTHREE